MKAKRLLIAVLILALAALFLNQRQLQRQLKAAIAQSSSDRDAASQQAELAADKLRQAEARLSETETELKVAEQKLADAATQLAQLDTRLRQLEATGQRQSRRSLGFVDTGDLILEPTTARSGNTAKRSWGPEQAAGEPDTFQAGDISTAWASREPDGGEEWLKVDYEKSVDIAEVRVRETYNPGAISKVTALLANGSELTLWEGVEPKAEAPVEMSFQVPESVNAKSIKVYLDTTRVPGWNEIDAVQLIGRDGSQQWATQATASSTYAEPRGSNRTRLVEERF
jgi:hypothetical protein